MGRLTPGDLIVFTSYLSGMYSPVRQLAKLAGIVSRGQAAAERIAETLDSSEQVPQRPHAHTPARVRGELAVAGVSFAYPGGPPVVSGIDLHVASGRRLALVGATGSGKSTLLRMIVRFVDPTEGAVLLDGVDVRDLTLRGLRSQVAYVPQEAYIFRGAVWENIAYGGNEISRDGAIAAARAAGVHEVIAGLPDGYDTLISERGATLSGGQRQCVAVARAMARDAPVLLLDEPTVGLDAEAEMLLVGALARLSEGRTTIVVSHQLQAVRDADQIAVLEGGRIAEAGTHRDLLRARSTYWRLQEMQRGSAPIVGAPVLEEAR